MSTTEAPRGLERRLFETLLSGEWIDAHDNLAICGPTGIGKSWLACAIGHKACRDNRSVLYVRFTRLLDELALARGDGRIASRLKSLASVELLILDFPSLSLNDGSVFPRLAASTQVFLAQGLASNIKHLVRIHQLSRPRAASVPHGSAASIRKPGAALDLNPKLSRCLSKEKIGLRTPAQFPRCQADAQCADCVRPKFGMMAQQQLGLHAAACRESAELRSVKRANPSLGHDSKGPNERTAGRS